MRSQFTVQILQVCSSFKNLNLHYFFIFVKDFWNSMKTKQNKKQKKRFYKSSAQVLNPFPITDIVEKNRLSFPSRKTELYGLEKCVWYV